MIQLTAYVSGRVQRVGYRAKVRASACGRDKKTCKWLGRWLIKKLRLLTTEAQSSQRRLILNPIKDNRISICLQNTFKQL
jgi:hypothetical protein